MKIIAHIRSDFPDKFGIPRQSGLVDELEATVVFEPEYRVPEALRELDSFSHIWLIWQFSECEGKEWSPTVRPPRLGGNKRVGVFASRSPFRPNPIGLSCVKLNAIEETENSGFVLKVSGADLLDGTPIYDIKPYLPYVDSHPEATGGFALQQKDGTLKVEIPDELLENVCEEKRKALIAVLSQDPRPQYQNDPERIYGMDFAGYNIKFRVSDDILKVTDISHEVIM